MPLIYVENIHSTARYLLVTSRSLAIMKMFASLQHIKRRVIELNEDIKPSAMHINNATPFLSTFHVILFEKSSVGLIFCYLIKLH